MGASCTRERQCRGGVFPLPCGASFLWPRGVTIFKPDDKNRAGCCGDHYVPPVHIHTVRTLKISQDFTRKRSAPPSTTPSLQRVSSTKAPRHTTCHMLPTSNRATQTHVAFLSTTHQPHASATHGHRPQQPPAHAGTGSTHRAPAPSTAATCHSFVHPPRLPPTRQSPLSSSSPPPS